MDIKLRLFCTVAETKSFSRASRIVHLSQPAVSLQIQALEEFFGIKLFDRSGDTISLTRAGEILYSQAKHVLEHYSEIEREISRITGMIKGGVTVGASTTLGNHVLPQVIINFKKKHPKIKITMMIGNTKRIEDLLVSRFIDFGIVAGETSKAGLKSDPIMSDELSVIVPPAHPWAKKKVISVLEMTREPFILREEGSGTRRKIEDFFSGHGISIHDLHVPLVLGSTESIKEAVEAGIGVSIVSKWAIRKEVVDGRLKVCALKEGTIERRLSIIMMPKAAYSHANQEFLLFVRKYPFASLFS